MGRFIFPSYPHPHPQSASPSLHLCLSPLADCAFVNHPRLLVCLRHLAILPLHSPSFSRNLFNSALDVPLPRQSLWTGSKRLLCAPHYLSTVTFTSMIY